MTLLSPESAAAELAQKPEDLVNVWGAFRSAMDHNRRNYTYALESVVMLVRSRV